MSAPEHIVILGGGISGLSSAFHLSRSFPESRITLIEKEDRLGGWIRSERVTVRTPAASSSILLEAGPRTLRPVDKSVLELVHLLGLTPQLVTTPKSSPAAKSRFLHVPELSGGRGLVPLPSSLWSLLSPWSESLPLARILLPAVLTEPFWSANRSLSTEVEEDAQDESVDSFFTRRLGHDFARVFGSALVHGIYAADSRNLSVRSAFPSLWDAETRGNGSVLLGMFRSAPVKPEEVYEVGDLVEQMKTTSVFSFKEGIEELPRALERYLVTNENVRLLKGTAVTGLRMTDTDRVEVALDSSTEPRINATHVVSTLPLPILHDILSSSSGSLRLPHLTTNPNTTVTVVNIVFAAPSDSIYPAGFGYLVPRRADADNTTDDVDTDVLPIIGTVFDSCSLSAQDDPATFTKITVMIKGDHPLPPSPTLTSTSTPAIPELILQILSSLSTHLARELPDPVFWRAHVNRNCIPTYTPGHRKRMQDITTKAQEAWNSRLVVVGSGMGGVSVGDCVRAGRGVVDEWTHWQI
ncbi:protoporphyrinogen oxidase [Amanita muscaria]